MRIGEACTRFLNHCEHTRKLSHHTLRAYRMDLDEFQRYAADTETVGECDKHLLRNYIGYLFDARGLKAGSVKRRMACLKAMFHWLEEDEILAANPFRTLSTPIKLPSRLPRGLNQTELRDLLNAPAKALGYGKSAHCAIENLIAAGNSRQGFIQFTTLVTLELLFATGIRVSELAAIEIKDIDLSDHSIRIHGKGDRERLVYLPDARTHDLLQGYLTARGAKAPNTTHFLVNTQGKATNPQYLRLLVRRAGEAAKIERRITPHMLRHSTATHLLNEGADIRHVQRLLGHQSITTTQIYTQVSDRMLKSVICRSHPIRKIAGGINMDN